MFTEQHLNLKFVTIFFLTKLQAFKKVMFGVFRCGIFLHLIKFTLTPSSQHLQLLCDLFYAEALEGKKLLNLNFEVIFLKTIKHALKHALKNTKHDFFKSLLLCQYLFFCPKF